MKEILQDLSFEELGALVLSLGEKKFRASQLWRGLMQGKKISDITDLPKAFKAKLLERFEDEPLKIADLLRRHGKVSFRARGREHRGRRVHAL